MGLQLVYILVSFSAWNRGLLNLSQALRGCCGEPTEHGCLVGETTASPFGLGPNDSMVMLPRFRWLFLDSEKAWVQHYVLFTWPSLATQIEGSAKFTIRLWLGNLFERCWLLVIHEGDR